MRLSKALPVFLIVAAILLLHQRAASNAASSVEPQRRRTGSSTQRRRAPAPARRDYTKFSHRTEQHRLLACDRCHKVPTPNWTSARAEGESFPDVTDYPDHPSCIQCHTRQFFTGARPPICTVCHTTVSPRDGTRFVFRNPGRLAPRGAQKTSAPTQFAPIFPHDKHQDVMAQLDGEPGGQTVELTRPSFRFVRASFQQSATQPRKVDSCSICHQTVEPRVGSTQDEMSGRPETIDAALWPKKGTFKSTPSGHDSCFSCHWREGGVEPLASNCAGCHKLMPPPTAALDKLRPTDASAAVITRIADPSISAKLMRRESARFLHDEEKHAALGCTSCHVRIASISTIDPQTLEVPLLSCGGTGTGCHIGPKPVRILNDEVKKKRADASFECSKCHIAYGREQLPKSHTDAVPLPTPAKP